MSEGREEIRRRFPHVMQEVDERKSVVHVDAVRTDREEAEKVAHNVQGYEPTVIDYLRRCDTDEQALEIIAFLEARGEIKPSHATWLREQLVRQGLRSFGGKKNHGYYERG